MRPQPPMFLPSLPALYVKAEGIPSPYKLSTDMISRAYMGGDLNTITVRMMFFSSAARRKWTCARKTRRRADSSSISAFYGDNGTTTGAKQVVACVLTDQNGTVKYYGQLADSSGMLPSTMAVTVPMARVADSTYTLSIFTQDTAAIAISQPSPTRPVTVSNRVAPSAIIKTSHTMTLCSI